MKSKRKILYAIIFFLIIGLIITIHIGKKNRIVNADEVVEQKNISYRKIELNQSNCQYSFNEMTSTITLESYCGNEECIIIPAEIDGYEIKSINTNAFKECYNLEQIEIAKEIEDAVGEIEDFEKREDTENNQYIEYVTTKEYNKSYLDYMNLPEKEQIEVIPSKFVIPLEKVYSEEINEIYGANQIEEMNPSKYDLRDYIDIGVENQQSFGICYAYPALSAVETNLALRNNEMIDLSEIHLATMTNGDGGTFNDIKKYFGTNKGPVFEEDWSMKEIHNNTTTENYNIINKYLRGENIDEVELSQVRDLLSNTKAVKNVTKTIDIPMILQRDKEDESKKEEVAEIRKIIKEHIKTYGALWARISMVEYYSYNGHMVKNSNYADISLGHGVTIVGWDDNFSKENFPSNCRPKQDGAYLVLNSYGEEWGENGYFWVSYEDEGIESDLHGVVCVEDTTQNFICNSMNIINIENNEKIKEFQIIKGNNIQISINTLIKKLIPNENEFHIMMRNNEMDITKNAIISGKEITNNEPNILINLETKTLQAGQYIIEISYGDETISKQIEIQPNTFDYKINEDEQTITITKYTGNLTEIEVPREYLGYPVTGIDENAFRNNNNLVSITIYENILYIGFNAFPGGVIIYGLSGTIIEQYSTENYYRFIEIGQKQITGNCWHFNINEKKLYITGDLVSDEIPWHNFKNNIVEIEISEGVKSIKTYEFCEYINLVHIQIPQSITTIGKGAFAQCINLKEITIPNDITTIESSTFDGCSSLTKIELPEGVTEIGISAFSGCSSLREIILPNSITNIGDFTFYQCISLNSINIPENVTNIGNHAFYQCGSLNSINIPENVINIGNFAFYQCVGLNKIEIPKGVTKIGESTFESCMNINEVKILGTVMNIEMNAFRSCKNLTKINLPEGVTQIGQEAFSECSNLNNIELPKSIENIGKWAFANTGIEYIEIPSSVTEIGYAAFEKCYKLEEVELKANIESIEPFTFSECIKLKKVALPNGLSRIGQHAFDKCSLKEIKIPSSVIKLEGCAFSRCSSLINIEIPEYITEIEKDILERAVLHIPIQDRKDRVDLPDILKRAQRDGGELTYINCVASQDKNYIELSNEGESQIIVKGGPFNNFIVSFEKVNLNSIKITREPTKKAYMLGEKFDAQGMVVEAVYSNEWLEMAKEITDYEVINERGDRLIGENAVSLTKADTVLTIRYTDETVEKIVDYEITIIGKEQGSINITNNLNKVYDGNPVVNPNYTKQGNGEETIEWYELDGKNNTENKINYKPINAGKYKVKVKLSETTDYTSAEAEQEFIINKSIPKYIVPSNLTAKYGQVLKNVELPTGFTWKDENARVGEVGENTFKVTYTPEDTNNYEIVEDIVIKVTVKEKPSEETAVLGDVNGNGKINTYDAVMILQHIAKKIQLTDEQIKLADTNKDNKINTYDAVRILQYIAKKIDKI